MSFEVETGHASARGPRDVNEDFAGTMRAPAPQAARGLVAAVADGVSTGGQGLEAAQTTVMGLLADFFATPATWETTVAFDRLISAQNAWLTDHNRRRSGGQAALTTLTALALQGQTWTLAHVGDTRAWRLRDGELAQLTQDHAFDHPDQRSRLTRAVGLDDVVRVDYAQGDARVGDLYLLTTDGVHGRLKPLRIAALAAAPGSAQQRCDALVQAALQAGSTDNATALMVQVLGVDARALDDEVADLRRLPAAALLKLGDELDGMTVTALVADNGVHRLYQARRNDTRALVALKTLHLARASDLQERDMLAHEAWLGQRLSERGDAGFVRVHARQAQASALYVVFDWISGRTIEQRMKSGERVSVADATEAAVGITQALARLHRLGVVHRDVKPGNLHLGEDGVWRVLDLGAASSGRERSVQRQLRAGTPSYMNPEQWDGAAATAGSDLFALGVSLYQWLTGRLPYGEIEPFQTARYRRDPTHVSRLRPDVPIWLAHVLGKAVARDPRARFETAEELLLALQRGASRPLPAPGATPLVARDPTALWKIGLGVSLLFNALLVLWLLFLPK